MPNWMLALILCLPLSGQFRVVEIGAGLSVVYAARLADIDGDGKRDILAITGTKVIWYENPTWKAHVISEGAAPADHVSIAAEDINGDGLMDIALAAEWQPRERRAKGTVHWLEQMAGGKWKLHEVARLAGAHRMQWGDIDGDGRKELIAVALDGKAVAYRMPGWEAELLADDLELSHQFFLEDMDDDGILDVVIGSKKGVETFHREKNGTWQRFLTGKGGASEIVIGRVNGARVAATIQSFHGDDLVLYEEPRQPLTPLGQPPNPKYHTALGTPWPETFRDGTVFGGHALGWGDFDGDGSDELAFGYRGKRTGIGTLKRNADGKWERGAAVDGEGMSPEDLTIGDLNGDGKPDLVACGRATGNIRIYWNESRPSWVRHEVASGFQSLTAAGIKLNGAGAGRGIISNGENRTRLYVNGLGKEVVLHSGTGIIHSAVLDIDGDGDEDFAGARYSPGYLFWLEQPAKPLEEPWKFHLVEDSTVGGIDGIHGLFAYDIDRDGKLDLIANSGQAKGPFANSIVWLKALDRGTRWQRNVFAKGDAAGLSHYHGAGDLNGDGLPDIVSAAKAGAEGQWFAWWEQTAAGPWKKHVLSDKEDGATNPLVVDVNGDGKMDVIASRGHGVGLLWFEGPNFVKHEIDGTVYGPHSLAVGDMDGDGDIDAVTCAKDSMVVMWFENDGKGNFTKRAIHESQAAYDIRLVDLDGDTDLDVLVAGQNSKNVVWFENRLKR